jgi:phasin family protein
MRVSRGVQAIYTTAKGGHMQRTEMQNSMEVGAEVTRTGLNAAIRIGHQTIEAYRQCAQLQADSTDQMLDEGVKITKALLGDGDAHEAIALWGKACERNLKRSFEASRGISESALKAQSEMIEAAGQLLSVVTDNAVATAKASSTALTRAAHVAPRKAA